VKTKTPINVVVISIMMVGAGALSIKKLKYTPKKEQHKEIPTEAIIID